MSTRILSSSTYVGIYVILMGITCISVGCSFLHLWLTWHVVIGVSLGVCKSTLVVLFFMHVIHSSKLTRSVIVVAVFWLGILFVLTLADYFSRDMVPYMQGH